MVLSLITKLFNVMVYVGHVPTAFGQGLIVPLLKGDKRSKCYKIEDYWGITISPIISKVFEICLFHHLQSYFLSSDRQFGFKRGVGCSDAIYTIRKVVDYFSKNGSTVNVCSLDLRLAFDRLNHCTLFAKLMDRNVRICIIKVLQNWYSKLFFSVKLNNASSE